MKILIGIAVIFVTLLAALLLWWLAFHHLQLFNRLVIAALLGGLAYPVWRRFRHRR